MLTYQKIIDAYIRNANDESMKALVKETGLFIEEVNDIKPELVDKFITKVDLILNPHFTKETAKYAVSQMENKDGSKGEHWDYETTTKVLRAEGYNYNEADWYFALNMIYSDYYKSDRSDSVYIELACDFIGDVDAPEDKVKKYFRAMRY